MATPATTMDEFSAQRRLAMAGRHDEAIEHLRRAVAANPRMREVASNDSELDSIRNRADYPA